jgi:hypothetical protein
MYEKFAVFCGCPAEPPKAREMSSTAKPASDVSKPAKAPDAAQSVSVTSNGAAEASAMEHTFKDVRWPLVVSPGEAAVAAATNHSVRPRSSSCTITNEIDDFVKSSDDVFIDAADEGDAANYWEIYPSQMDCLRGISGAELMKHWDDWTARVLEYKDAARDIEGVIPSWVPKKVTPLLIIAGHGPIIDGHPEGLLDFPIKLIEERRVPGLEHIGLVAGLTSDEGTLLTVALLPMIPGVSFVEATIAASDALVDTSINWTFSPVQGEKIRRFYKSFDYKTPKEKMSRVLSDLLFACPILDLMNAWPNPNKHLYLFDVKLPIVDTLLGVPHALDVPFVLRRDTILWYLAGGWYFKEAQHVSKIFSRAFVDMATHGRTRWPAWTVGDGDVDIPRLYAKFTLEEVSIEQYGEDMSIAFPSKSVCKFWKHDVGILDWLDLSGD